MIDACAWCGAEDRVEGSALGAACRGRLQSSGYDLGGQTRAVTAADPVGGFRKGRISASSLSTFVKCPEQYRRKYMLEEWGPAGVSQIVGSTIHGAAERAWRHKIFDGELPEWSIATDMLDEAWARQVNQDVDWRGVTASEAKRRALDVFGVYYRDVAPRVEPFVVETWATVRVPGVPIPVVGVIDLIGRVPLPAGAAVARLDLKSSGKGAAKNVEPDWRIAGDVYMLIDDLPMVWHAMTWKGKNGPVVRTPTSPDVEPDALQLRRTAASFAGANTLVRRLVAGIRAYHAAFGPDEPWPSGAKAHTWACSYCDFRDTDCVYWHGERDPLLDELAAELGVGADA